ncbi:hypothetical protein L0128_00475 [candidate division KSB1 bacterium]|nr:hypothetical protein [candidate division KSB1 bacterium]
MMLEKTIKIILMTVLVVAGGLYWLLPRIRWAQKLKLNETTFLVTNYIGAVTAILGIIATFVWSDLIVETHLMWLLLLPIALVHIYWLFLIRVNRTADLLDEKQNFDMTSGAATALYIFLLLLFVLFNLEYNQIHILNGIQYFPFYFFVLFLAYHASTLFYFKRN